MRDKDLIDTLNAAISALTTHQFEPLVEELVQPEDEDADKVKRLRCPWCMQLVGTEDSDAMARVTYGVLRHETWYNPEGDGEVVTSEDNHFYGSDGETLYYLHNACGNPVVLPEGWTGAWN